MSVTKDMPLSLKSDTFNSLCSDFDQVLRSTLSGMVDTEQDVAEVNIKVKITLTESSAPDYTVAGGQQTREITKPKFEHTVTAVIQRKEKKTGTLSGEYELVWDRESGGYVMRPIDSGQMTMDDFGPKGDVIDAEYTVVNGSDEDARGLPEGHRGLPEPSHDGEGSDTAESDGDVPEAAGEFEEASGEPVDRTDPDTPFGWMLQFVGQDLRVTEAMGNYTVRTMDNKVVLSSATSPTSPFYCPAERLEPHVGHHVYCTGYGPDPDEIVNVSVECEDCSAVLFDINAPDIQDVPGGVDKAEDITEEDPEDEGGYDYEAPEE